MYCVVIGQPFPHNDNFQSPEENIVGKGENAGYQYFLLFPQCFLLYERQISYNY